MTDWLKALVLLLGTAIAVLALNWFLPRPSFQLLIEPSSGDPSAFVTRVIAKNDAARRWLLSHRSAPDWGHYLKVRTDQSNGPLFGTFEQSADELSFRPAVAPLPGSQVYVIFTDGKSHRQSFFEVPNPEKDRITPRLLSIHPSADVLPENLIKFYIEFSQPMTQGDFFQHVELLNENTFKSVPGAFREVELWSPDGRRFTLWLHPGRQKTGVNLNEDEGPVLREGGRYTLQVWDTLTSRSGARLNESVGKTFTVGPHDGTQPDLKHWQVTSPGKGTQAPLAVVFDKPMDWAMLENVLWVTDIKGDRVAGAAANTDAERKWIFSPKQVWAPGSYTITINPEVEDLAGNSLVRAFESDGAAASQSSGTMSQLTFTVEP